MSRGENGGPQFKFTEAISLTVNCDSQKEIDTLWNRLSASGQEVACGWLKDRYGLCWQIVPKVIQKLLRDKNPERAERVMAAVMQMKKLDLKALKAAAKKPRV